MKPFEFGYLCAEPFLPPLMKLVRKRLRILSKGSSGPLQMLDVGGRKSHYTIGVHADVTVTDLPRESDLQHQLNLGLNEPIIQQAKRRRTNISRILLDDMTHSQLPDESFDCVVAVEVLEHVELDADFVREVHRVLKTNGVFLMTTPNGDFVVNRNPDHKRHYHRLQLADLLGTCFDDVTVDYAVRGGRYRRWGRQSWSPKRPYLTALSMLGNVLNTIESRGEAIKAEARGTHHLVAQAYKGSRRASEAAMALGKSKREASSHIADVTA